MNQEFRDQTRRLLTADGGVPFDHNRDVEKFFSRTVPALADRGFFGLLVPPVYGGRGYSVSEFVAAQEILGEYDTMAAYAVNEHCTIGSLPLVDCGTAEQKERWLPELASGRCLSAFCLTEPKSGSDVTKLDTKAVAEATGYRLNGRKIHISLAHHAGLFTVLAEVDGAQHSGQKTAFLIPRDTTGLGFGPENSSPSGYLIPVAGAVELRDCIVSPDAVLGGVGFGGGISRTSMETGRVGLMAALVGSARGALKRCLGRVMERQSFGKSIGEHQLVQAKLANIAIGLDACHLMVERAAKLIDEHSPAAPGASARTKVFVSETVRDIGIDAVQIFGGQSFLERPPIDWYMRDAKMAEMLGGTSEILRIIIAKDLYKFGVPAQ